MKKFWSLVPMRKKGGVVVVGGDRDKIEGVVHGRCWLWWYIQWTRKEKANFLIIMEMRWPAGRPASQPAAEKQQHIVFFNRPIIVYKTNPGYVGRYTIWFLSYLSVQMLAKPKTRISVQYFSSVSYGQNVKESSKYHLQQNLMQRWFNYAVNQWPIL